MTGLVLSCSGCGYSQGQLLWATGFGQSLKMDAEFPTFTQSLLETIYPDYLAPTPSMSIVHFVPDEVGTWSYVASFRSGNDVAVPVGRVSISQQTRSYRQNNCSTPGPGPV